MVSPCSPSVAVTTVTGIPAAACDADDLRTEPDPLPQRGGERTQVPGRPFLARRVLGGRRPLPAGAREQARRGGSDEFGPG